ncbi:MAG: indolepyruvate oxidoreductase subunit beta [Planctomycetes bacterium]|nr:indolepyruvate oxidoreductase subunit beta [Planctomycetota bacterium]
MKCDVILAGVGGQGVLSVAALIASAALREGLHMKQSEVHGMAQRGGAVVCHLRLSDQPIWSDLVPRGQADLIISMDPIESLRHVDWLAPTGWLVTSTRAVDNIPGFTDARAIVERINSLPHTILVDTEALARKAGSTKAGNVVLVGAAARLLPIKIESVLTEIRERFGRMGPDMVALNERALAAGQEQAPCRS